MTSPTAREERSAQGAAVHTLLEWSKDHEWREPPAELAREHAAAVGLDPDRAGLSEALLDPVRGWLGSALLRERVGGDGVVVRAEAPILLGSGGSVLRGSIDLLVEREGESPLVIDYKTDRLGGAAPAERAAHYGTQRGIYALAVAESRQADEVEVAYVFLERPDEPVLFHMGPTELSAARKHLDGSTSAIGAGEFKVAPPEERDWGLCRGCPALGRLCSGPPTET